jgi:hypothetical protein
MEHGTQPSYVDQSRESDLRGSRSDPTRDLRAEGEPFHIESRVSSLSLKSLERYRALLLSERSAYWRLVGASFEMREIKAGPVVGLVLSWVSLGKRGVTPSIVTSVNMTGMAPYY